jgi:hypothetical protein
LIAVIALARFLGKSRVPADSGDIQLLFPVIQTVQVGKYIDEMLAAERAHPFQHVVVEASSSISGKEVRSRVDLSMDRSSGKFLFSFRGVQANGVPFDRVFYVAGGHMTVYDASRNEYVVRKLDKALPIGAELIKKAGIDPGVLIAIDPSTADSLLFKSFRSLNGWQQTRVEHDIELFRNDKGNDRTTHNELRLNETTHFPTGVAYLQNGHGVSSQLTYSKAPSWVSFIPPAGSRKVDSFTPVVSRPKFAPGAQKVAGQCKSSYDALRSVEVSVQGGDSSSFSWQKGSAFQVSPLLTWAYDGEILTIVDKVGRGFYHGQVSRGSIPGYLGLFKKREEPILLQLMAGENPLEMLYASNQAVRYLGDVSTNKGGIKILGLYSTDVRTQVTIDSGSHLITGLETENLDQTGHVVSKSSRQFKINEVNRPIGRSQFQLKPPAGYKVIELPKI